MENRIMTEEEEEEPVCICISKDLHKLLHKAAEDLGMTVGEFMMAMLLATMEVAKEKRCRRRLVSTMMHLGSITLDVKNPETPR